MARNAEDIRATEVWRSCARPEFRATATCRNTKPGALPLCAVMPVRVLQAAQLPLFVAFQTRKSASKRQNSAL